MKENEREREVAGTRKPTLRSEFDTAYADVIAEKSEVVADVDEKIDDDEENVDAEVVFENVDTDDEMDNESAVVDAVASNDDGSGASRPNGDDFGRFCVGMVMRHKKYNYFCVVYGWDPICKASKVSLSRFSPKQPNSIGNFEL